MAGLNLQIFTACTALPAKPLPGFVINLNILYLALFPHRYFKNH
jgi:hypothetical protein